MIAMSWSPQRVDSVNVVEDLEPELGADLTRDTCLSPSCENASDELDQGREEPEDRNVEHRISAPEVLKPPDGSGDHRGLPPSKRARKNTSRRRDQGVAGRMHQ
jgi:hypothetical protein